MRPAVSTERVAPDIIGSRWQKTSASRPDSGAGSRIIHSVSHDARCLTIEPEVTDYPASPDGLADRNTRLEKSPHRYSRRQGRTRRRRAACVRRDRDPVRQAGGRRDRCARRRVGTREEAALRPESTVETVDGIALSGGSALGLDSAGGVQAWLAEQGRGLRIRDALIPIVPGAICFDLLNRGDKCWGRF